MKLIVPADLCLSSPVPSIVIIKNTGLAMSHSKTAIVTGASRGIGAAIAKRLSQANYNIIVNYARSAGDADQVVRQIHAGGGQALAIQADVSSTSDVCRLFDEAEQHFGSVDVLINNAGVLDLSSIAEVSEESIHQHVDINLKGVMFCSQQAVNRLNNGGHIVNLSTSVVGLKLENYAVYAATKAGVETFSAITAKELRGRDITVNAVAPGPTETDLFMQGKSEELVDKLRKMPPLERLAQPEEIAAVVAFLCSPDGSWVNGQVIRANGGIV